MPPLARPFIRFTHQPAQELVDRVRTRNASATAIVRAVGTVFIMQAMRIGMARPDRGKTSDVPIVIFVTHLSGAGGARKSAIEGFSLLSQAEKEVLIGLVDDRSVEAIAAASDRAIATVRWHVKKMLTKTGARTIGDLTRIGSLLAPH